MNNDVYIDVTLFIEQAHPLWSLRIRTFIALDLSDKQKEYLVKIKLEGRAFVSCYLLQQAFPEDLFTAQ